MQLRTVFGNIGWRSLIYRKLVISMKSTNSIFSKYLRKSMYLEFDIRLLNPGILTLLCTVNTWRICICCPMDLDVEGKKPSNINASIAKVFLGGINYQGVRELRGSQVKYYFSCKLFYTLWYELWVSKTSYSCLLFGYDVLCTVFLTLSI